MPENLTEHQCRHIIELLERGEQLPYDYKHLLFPPERKEYEMVNSKPSLLNSREIRQHALPADSASVRFGAAGELRPAIP